MIGDVVLPDSRGPAPHLTHDLSIGHATADQLRNILGLLSRLPLFDSRHVAESKEGLDLVSAVKVVDGLGGAVDHINRYGSHHTDAIVTKSTQAAATFVAAVDSSSVMVNASTRFSDGGEYGLGAEIGISTDKLHARGPMGAEDLTTYKWVVTGNGHLRT